MYYGFLLWQKAQTTFPGFYVLFGEKYLRQYCLIVLTEAAIHTQNTKVSLMNVREGTEVLIEHRLAALTVPHLVVNLLLCSLKKHETSLKNKD